VPIILYHFLLSTIVSLSFCLLLTDLLKTPYIGNYQKKMRPKKIPRPGVFGFLKKRYNSNSTLKNPLKVGMQYSTQVFPLHI